MAGKSKDDERQDLENIIVAADHGRLDLVTALLEGGTDPNMVNDIGTSALHNAAKRGHWDIARLLLEKNASPQIQDGNDATPLRLAARAGHAQIARLLLECHSPGEQDLYNTLRTAAAFGHAEVVQLLLDRNVSTLSNKETATPLHFAAKNGHNEVCKILLNHDKSLNRSLWDRMVGPSLQVDTKDYGGSTPFAYAVERSHQDTVDVFLRLYPEIYKTCDREGTLLFHRAIVSGKVNMVRTFLNHGVDIEIQDNKGRRAIHHAVLTEHMGFGTGPTEIIQLLLENGASADAKGKYGDDPASYTRNPKTKTLLRNHTARQSKGGLLLQAPMTVAPPPEYKA